MSDEEEYDEEYFDENDDNEEEWSSRFEDNEEYGQTFAQRQETYVVKDACGEGMLPDMGGRRPSIMTDELRLLYFRLDVCNYLNIIQDLFPASAGIKDRLVSDRTLSQIRDMDYKNIAGYTLGYFATENGSIDARVVKKMEDTMAELRITDIAVVIRYARFWMEHITL